MAAVRANRWPNYWITCILEPCVGFGAQHVHCVKFLASLSFNRYRRLSKSMVRLHSMTSHYDYPLTSYRLCPSCFPSWCQRNLPNAANTPAIAGSSCGYPTATTNMNMNLLKLFPKLFLEFFLQCSC